MCVIAIKTAGVAMPSMEEIKAMWNANPDGAGFMYPENGMVHIRKGFLELEDFIKALGEFEISHTNVNDIPMVMHFRIGTHGAKTSAECTHPFPVSADDLMLTATELSVPLAYAHNGIISSIPTDDKLSDTMMYGKIILASLYNSDPNFYKNEATQWLIEQTINDSRMCFMDGNGVITKVGQWTTDAKTGLIYSNTHFKFYMYDWYDGFPSRRRVSSLGEYTDFSSYSGYGYRDGFGSTWEGYGDYEDDYNPIRDVIEESTKKIKSSRYCDKMDKSGNVYKKLSQNAMLVDYDDMWYSIVDVWAGSACSDIYVDQDGYVYYYDDGMFYSADEFYMAYDLNDDGILDPVFAEAPVSKVKATKVKVKG